MAITTDKTMAVVKNRLMGDSPPPFHAAGSKCTNRRCRQCKSVDGAVDGFIYFF
jgi:hypothetical protein